MLHNRAEILVFAAMVCLAGCGTSAEVPLPAGLIGRWTTTNPDYIDRYFELRTDSIILGTGGRTSERYDIIRILETRDEDGVLYTVEYGNADDEFKMSFFFDAPRSQVRLENQPRMIWRKAAS